jgi:BirA family biotin operon repressor/biotin-[acetyl-CoA-carboxylase] ligase
MNVIHLDTCKSTNSLAREVLDQAPNQPLSIGTVIVARKQTQGKGRSGTWFSPEDCGIYMSVITPWPTPTENECMATVETCTRAVGFRIMKLLQNYFHLNTYVQGINDIYLAGRKLAGILCEYHTASDKLIIGVGLNTFRPSKVRKDLLRKAVWLNEYSCEALIDHSKLVTMIAEEMLKI